MKFEVKIPVSITVEVEATSARHAQEVGIEKQQLIASSIYEHFDVKDVLELRIHYVEPIK